MLYFCLAEGAMKARREIADYIKNKRTERARIRVSGVVHCCAYQTKDTLPQFLCIVSMRGVVERCIPIFLVELVHDTTLPYYAF